MNILYIIIAIYLAINCFIAGWEAADRFDRRKPSEYLALLFMILFGSLYYVIYFLGYFLLLLFRSFIERWLHNSKLGFKFLIHVCGQYKDPDEIRWDEFEANINKLPKRQQGYATWALNYLKKIHNK